MNTVFQETGSPKVVEFLAFTIIVSYYRGYGRSGETRQVWEWGMFRTLQSLFYRDSAWIWFGQLTFPSCYKHLVKVNFDRFVIVRCFYREEGCRVPYFTIPDEI